LYLAYSSAERFRSGWAARNRLNLRLAFTSDRSSEGNCRPAATASALRDDTSCDTAHEWSTNTVLPLKSVTDSESGDVDVVAVRDDAFGVSAVS
jgi:hypothetical protein